MWNEKGTALMLAFSGGQEHPENVDEATIFDMRRAWQALLWDENRLSLDKQPPVYGILWSSDDGWIVNLIQAIAKYGLEHWCCIIR